MGIAAPAAIDAIPVAHLQLLPLQFRGLHMLDTPGSLHCLQISLVLAVYWQLQPWRSDLKE